MWELGVGLRFTVRAGQVDWANSVTGRRRKRAWRGRTETSLHLNELGFGFMGMRDNKAMNGIQFVTDEKGRKVAVQIDLKKHGAVLQDFWDGLISESRRKEKGIPLEKVKADLVKRGRHGCRKLKGY